MPEQITISIDGRPAELVLDLLEVIVDTNLHLPAMFTITVQDEYDHSTSSLKYADANTFSLGAQVKIEVETDELPNAVMPVKATLISGEITAIEPVFSLDGKPVLHIRGYDRSHRLTRGKKTRTFGDANPNGSGIDEKQIISMIAQEAGFSAKVAPDLASLKYTYVIQYNQTDMECLWSRAHLLGYQLYVEDKTLYFQAADAHRGRPTEQPRVLKWGESLRDFRPRLSLMYQVDKATVKGWDPGKKDVIVGTASADNSKTIPKIGLGKKGSAEAKRAFSSSAEAVLVDHPVGTQSQAKTIAEAMFAEAESQFIQAEGSCLQGDPRLIAGRVVKIEGVGQRFGGDYYVTEARHTFTHGTYRVTFAVTGRFPNTISTLLQPHTDRAPGLISGVVTAKVTNLQDPNELGRVQVMYPWLPKYKEADLSSNWARLATPMGGNGRGFFFLPEVDDEVLVAFEHGDMNYPYIVGTLWNSRDKPPQGTAKALSDDKKQVNQRILRSRSGHLIILDDTQGQEKIIIQDKTAKNKIEIDSKENTMTINVEKDLKIVAKGNANLEAQGNITLKSTGDLSMECKNLSIKAQASGSVQANSGLDLKATGQLTLKGAQTSVASDVMTEVKSSAMVKVQGNPIMLN